VVKIGSEEVSSALIYLVNHLFEEHSKAHHLQLENRDIFAFFCVCVFFSLQKKGEERLGAIRTARWKQNSAIEKSESFGSLPRQHKGE